MSEPAHPPADAVLAAPGATGPRVVALGGGHGLAASLTALRQLTDRLTAVVTVADDGGSSGRLRAHYDLLPPGDLRMALAALAGQDAHSVLLRDTFQHRFPPASGADRVAGGYQDLAGHPVGNLLLAGLMLQTGDPVVALDTAARILDLPPQTRVLPMAREPLDIAAEVSGLPGMPGLATVRGQVEVATTRGRVVAVHLLPAQPLACPEAISAVEAADVVVLGPGSLFTSVLPHLLLPELRKAVTATPARRVLVLNLVAQRGETDGFSAASHLEVLAALVPELGIDDVIADRSALGPAAAARGSSGQTGSGPDANTETGKRGLIGDLHTAAEALGARVHLAALAQSDSPGVHDAAALAAAFRHVLGVRLGGGGRR